MAAESILLTGATGFLGARILEDLVNRGHSVIVLKRSFSDTSRIRPLLEKVRTHDIDRGPLRKLFEEAKVGTIIHCATNYGRKSIEPTQIIEANLLLPLTLLQLAREFGTRCFINTDSILDRKVSHYSLSKKQFLEWLKLFSKDLSCVNVALEHFYGPFDDPSKFVSKIVGELLRNVPRIDLTVGVQKRDFVYVDDVVAAFRHVQEFASHQAAGYFPFEVGSGELVRIRDFVELVKKLSGNTKTELKFGAIPLRENEVMESRLDLSALNALGWKPQVALEKGLSQMIAMEKKELKL
jgi:CDP-paratose synthetase